MASNGKVHQVFLVIFLVTCSIAFSNVEARESLFFSKANPVRRYSQLISSSMPALAPLVSVEVTPTSAPAPAPASAAALSEIQPASENYVYGFYNREVGEFPMATTKEEANAIKKKIQQADDEFVNTIYDNSGFGSEDEDEYTRDPKFTNYGSEYTSSNNRQVVVNHNDPDFQKRYRRSNNNNNVQNYKYTRSSYDDDQNDNMYTTNYEDDEDNTNERYADENQSYYYTDKFERTKPVRTFGRERFVNNGRRYYNDDNNGVGYYSGNQRVSGYNPMEEYEGVYQP